MPERLTKTRILIVEDERLVRLTLSEALADEGYDVVEASTGDEALVALRADREIMLLLTDIQLPGTLDGQNLARLAREDRPELPAIFVTGRPDTMADSLALPHDAFMPKPYVLSEVAAAIRRLTRAPM